MDLPGIDPVAVDRLTEYLRARSWSQRPANATARVFVLIIRLWQDKTPFPTRQEVADHLGVSVPTVDLVLARRNAGDLQIVYEGAVMAGRGKRWVVPSDTLMAIGRSRHGIVDTFRPAPYRRRPAQQMEVSP